MKKYRWGLAFGEGLAGQSRSRSTLTGSPRGPPPALRRERLQAATVGRSQSFRIVI